MPRQSINRVVVPYTTRDWVLRVQYVVDAGKERARAGYLLARGCRSEAASGSCTSEEAGFAHGCNTPGLLQRSLTGLPLTSPALMGAVMGARLLGAAVSL